MSYVLSFGIKKKVDYKKPIKQFYQVNDAERERIESEASHQLTTLTFKKRDDEVNKLQRDLKRQITKSK